MVNFSKIDVNLAFFLEKIDKKMEYLWFYSLDFVLNIFPGLVCHFWSGWRGKLRSWSYRDREIIFLTNWFLSSFRESILKTCDICLKSFDNKAHLNAHAKTHQLPLSCLICHKGFARKDSLIRNSQLHDIHKIVVNKYIINSKLQSRMFN